ncbi:MAG TPA: hypothetical protein VGL54_07095 [Solirubrobacteraceae bacterium]|jgi:hypothetical protein
MSLILSWVLFPLVLVAIGAGWGAIVERAAGARVNDALLLPLGLAAALVVAGTLTAFAATAPAAVTVVACGAVAGLLFAWPGGRLSRWPLLAALGVLLAYGAPVLLSGQATFLGFVKLDDTATWFNIIDNVMSHGRSVAGLPPSTYRLNFGQANPAYPLGSFMLPGVARALVGVDIAWVFQPYLACCAAAVALCLYALMEPLVASARIRALLAFVAAQSALLYGYSLWGGIKELTAAFLLVLGVALAAAILSRRPARARELLPLAVAAGALIQTLGVGAAGWVAPALVFVVVAWWLRGRRGEGLRPSVLSIAWLVGLTAAFVVPVWAVLAGFLENRGNLIDQLFSSGQSTHVKLGNLIQPLSGFQLAGIWPVGDFRLTAPTLPSVLLIGLVLIAAAAGLLVGIRRRHFGVALYVAVALIGCGVIYFAGATPWVTGKTLAISSPALLAAALTGGGMLWSRWGHNRAAGLAGAVVVAALAGGVLWSNVLAYSDVTLAPRARLAELQHIGGLVAGKGPTFVNEYEVYADRHFLRAGAPVEPAEYRSATLPLRDGAVLTKSAEADLDSFALATLEPYRSIVTPRSPTESRPPSIYKLVWQGSYYRLWQRPAHPTTRILEHVPLGESNALPYCGVAENGPPSRYPCSVDPVAIPPCPRIQSLARQAIADHARLVAYQRAAPIVARGDQTLWPGRWLHDSATRTLTATTPGTAVSHIAIADAERYELWLGGSFARGFEVSVDGDRVGTVKDELSAFGGYVHVADLSLAAGVHTFALTYPHAGLAPGSGDNELTSLSAIVLQPQNSPSALIEVAPRQASRLCGRPLDWIEIVARAG